MNPKALNYKSYYVKADNTKCRYKKGIGCTTITIMTSMKRVTAIDITRGLVMVIMALDHVRDLLHTPALTQNPTDLATTTPAIFMTRWITHLCAPNVRFSVGNVGLSFAPKATGDNWSTSESARRFLLKRGLVLILLELTVVNFAFWFDIHFQSLMLQVIYAIGGGLVILSLLAKLPVKWVGIIGLVIVFGHNLLQLVPTFTNPSSQTVWALFFRTDFFPVSPHFALLAGLSAHSLAGYYARWLCVGH